MASITPTKQANFVSVDQHHISPPTSSSQLRFHRLTWLSDKKTGHGDVLTAMLGNLGLGEEFKASWGGKTGGLEVTVHIPDIPKLTEEVMRERRVTKREREIEEASYREAQRMKGERWGPGVCFSDGSLMESHVGAREVNMLEPADLYIYVLGDRATVWDKE